MINRWRSYSSSISLAISEEIHRPGSKSRATWIMLRRTSCRHFSKSHPLISAYSSANRSRSKSFSQGKIGSLIFKSLRQLVNDLTCACFLFGGLAGDQVPSCRIDHAMKSNSFDSRSVRRSPGLIWALASPLFFIGHLTSRDKGPKNVPGSIY